MAKQRIEIEVEIPEGYEVTGEVKRAKHVLETTQTNKNGNFIRRCRWSSKETGVSR